MTDREKLIALIASGVACPDDRDPFGEYCDSCRYEKSADCSNERLADHLIAHGVTVQGWIPVTERLPELIPCNAGTAYSEAVNVLTTGRKVITAIWNGTDFIGDAEFWEAEDEEITHWTPVLLPLPQPPKGR